MTSEKPKDSIILTGMPTKLNSEIVAAAIAGFEEQKKRLAARIMELRNMLAPSVPNGAARGTNERRSMSAAARGIIAAAQRKRWAEARKQAGAASSMRTRKKRRLSRPNEGR